MKKTILTLSLTAMAVLGVTTQGKAQIKEGTITYTITAEGLPPEQAAFAQGMEMKTYFKNGKVRMDFSSAFMNSVTVSDGKGNGISLIEMMGQKTYSKNSAEDSKKNKDAAADPKITYTEDKKTIAGYECKKAIVEGKDEKGNTSSTTVWYTEKIPYSDAGGKRGGQFKGLKGAPLEFEQSQGPMKSKVSATSVTTSSVPDSKFEVSTEGYTEMNPADMMKGMGGQ